MVGSSCLDKTESMQVFLKGQRFITELNKAVSGMGSFIYPSVLQREAIPAVKKVMTKKGEHTSMVIRYTEMNGIKLTVLMPIFNAQIRQAVARAADEAASSKYLYSIVLCHSSMRCADLAEFSESLLEYCSGMIDIVNLGFGDFNETMTNLKHEL
jgi:hypothetical protein